ncbi:Fe/S biogenesis protein NfuA [Candidatus Gullanella endobia]|uniref:Fe/S biogenesis protein NfuA n=1 Tax=Candidatus Gullanella endobia TaxID=1070130 RepID=A0A143WQ40_9ENTR|nr:Fe-S biogenesis protein NfuA [Candidatus Gullanella endobia]CUX95731.1 Fe/S biogenesis protein NfuA [Candidatus Gullanella endobia]
MIFITNLAKEYIAKLLSNQKPGTQIRICVINPGTPNAECCILYCSPDSVEFNDIELKFGNISVYIDEFSFPYLQDMEIDFVTDKLSSQLTLKAPNAKIHKVSNSAPLIERVEYFIKSQINPTLASHSGKVELIEITNDMLAILQFSGRCNGCSMRDYTLKEGIEKELLKNFPELNGVFDITEHQHGNHSYY